jgi:hypothetical protein
MSHVSGASDFTGWRIQDDPHSRDLTRTTRVQKLFLTIGLEEFSNGRPSGIMLSGGVSKQIPLVCLSQSTLPQRFCRNNSSHHARVLRPFGERNPAVLRKSMMSRRMSVVAFKFLRPHGSTVANVQEFAVSQEQGLCAYLRIN